MSYDGLLIRMIALKEILAFLKSDVLTKEGIHTINNAKAITDSEFNKNSIGWCSDKNVNLLNNVAEGTVIVSNSAYQTIQSQSKSLVLIPVENPRLTFSKVLQKYFVSPPNYGEIATNVTIHSTVSYQSSTVSIGANVVIEKGCIIGDNVIIGANTVVKSDTIIEDNCSIGCNCTIGGVGFGYEQNELNEYELLPHIGNVHLKSGVEIGNNVCIDRAVMGSTLLSENVKVDNLVHIAHGVQIGKNSLIIANAMIAGSVVIGENVWVSPSASIRQKLELGNQSLVGLGSVVVKNVAPETIVAGNPAKEFSKK